jgi:hypothetical protein
MSEISVTVYTTQNGVESRLTWLDVSVDDVARVDVVQRGGHASHVEGHVALLEQQLLLQVVSQVAAGFQVQNQVAVVSE